MNVIYKVFFSVCTAFIISGCSPFRDNGTMTKPDVVPSHDYVTITNYDRIKLENKTLNVKVISSSPEKLTRQFDTVKAQEKVIERLTYEGFKVSLTGKEVIIDVTSYGFAGYATHRPPPPRQGSAVAGSLFGGGALSLVGSVAAGLVVDAAGSMTQKEHDEIEAQNYNLSTGFEATITVPADNYSTFIKARDKYSASSNLERHTPYAYEKIAQVMFEFVSP